MMEEPLNQAAHGATRTYGHEQENHEMAENVATNLIRGEGEQIILVGTSPSLKLIGFPLTKLHLYFGNVCS